MYVPNWISKSGRIIIRVIINPNTRAMTFFDDTFSFITTIPPRKINKGVVKLIATA